MRKAGLGIDIGNGSISIVVVEGENIIYKDYRLHRGELYQNLVDMLGQVETSCGDRILYAAVNPGAVCLYPGIQKKVQIQKKQKKTGKRSKPQWFLSWQEIMNLSGNRRLCPRGRTL